MATSRRQTTSVRIALCASTMWRCIAAHAMMCSVPAFMCSMTSMRQETCQPMHNNMTPVIQCRDPGSNWGPSDLQSDALPTELSRQLSSTCCRKSAVMLQPPTPLHLLQLPLSSDARCPLPWTISSSLALTCLPSLAPDFPHGADVCRSEQTAAESPQP